MPESTLMSNADATRNANRTGCGESDESDDNTTLLPLLRIGQVILNIEVLLKRYPMRGVFEISTFMDHYSIPENYKSSVYKYIYDNQHRTTFTHHITQGNTIRRKSRLNIYDAASLERCIVRAGMIGIPITDLLPEYDTVLMDITQLLERGSIIILANTGIVFSKNILSKTLAMV